jgi:hypothetical protein
MRGRGSDEVDSFSHFVDILTVGNLDVGIAASYPFFLTHIVSVSEEHARGVTIKSNNGIVRLS